MKNPGPPLETLTHRLAECPGEFLQPPRTLGGGVIRVDAVVCDLVRHFGGRILPPEKARVFAARCPDQDGKRLQLVLVTSWLLYDPWFGGKAELIEKVVELLTEKMEAFARVTEASACVNDSDRREELVRFCLKNLELRPHGESVAEAQDRLTALDSAERIRVARQTRVAEERARAIREAMARRAAEEAAAKYGRE